MTICAVLSVSKRWSLRTSRTGRYRVLATSIGVEIRDALVQAEGDLDFRGTLGVSKVAPVGCSRIRLALELDTDATEEQKATLLRLTERYCVVLQTLRTPPEVSARISGM
jgi:hypothetical protein